MARMASEASVTTPPPMLTAMPVSKGASAIVAREERLPPSESVPIAHFVDAGK